MIKTQSAGGIVINKGKVLLVLQKFDIWSFPKGHVEENEDILDAAKREIHEESGVTELNLIEKLGVIERFKIGKSSGEDKRELKEIHLFLFTTTQTHLQPIDPDNPEARWVNRSDVVQLIDHPKDISFFKSIESKLTQLGLCS
jgi:ADP-ribose pyrophosphatase YjhB (NUDIX family)